MPPWEKEAHFDTPLETSNGFPEKAPLVVHAAKTACGEDSSETVPGTVAAN
jgi:hypothetical protein